MAGTLQAVQKEEPATLKSSLKGHSVDPAKLLHVYTLYYCIIVIYMHVNPGVVLYSYKYVNVHKDIFTSGCTYIHTTRVNCVQSFTAWCVSSFNIDACTQLHPPLCSLGNSPSHFGNKPAPPSMLVSSFGTPAHLGSH